MNGFLEYYGEHNISPVVQDISNINIHYQKREKLYRQLGIPPIAFENKKILEVGPGGGYNTLAFMKWGGTLQLVEPNQRGREDMKYLFEKMKIDKNCYSIQACTIEQYNTEERYDIIIAEGFLHSIDNSRNIIHRLKNYAKDGGVIVITYMDNLTMFVEQMKRLICHILTKNETDYEKKVKISTEFFQPQFDDNKGMSRSVEDWVRDDMFNPAFNSKEIMDFPKALEYFGDEFCYLGSSQRMFTDYSWYKDLNYDEKFNLLRQYKTKGHNLMFTGLEESIISETENRYLIEKISEIRALECLYEETYESECITKITLLLSDLIHVLSRIDKKCVDFVEDVIKILSTDNIHEINFKEYLSFYKAVGRTQQYLSMVKKKKY